jgi:hypothetical protein
MGLIHPSRSRAPAVVLTALGLALVIVALVQKTPISAISGAAGPATVTVTPTDGLTDGQSVAVSATFAAGSVSEMRVHLCAHNAGIANTADFDLDGPFCSPFKVSPAADAEKFIAVAPADTSAAILNGFHVGIGTGAQWVDFFDTPHTLTCDSSHQCDIVVQFQITGGQSWFAAPLTFAGGSTTTTTTAPGTTTTTAPGTTTTSPTTTTAPGTTTTTAPATTTTTAPATTTTTAPGTTTTTAPGTTTTTTDPPSSTTQAPASTTTTFPTVVANAGAGGTGGASGVPTASGTGGLALTGVDSRDLASLAFITMAAGLFLLSFYYRRAPES